VKRADALTNALGAFGGWSGTNLMPVTESLLRKTAMLIRSPPPDVPLRAGDAIHTATALETGETEIWTNDRHLLAAVAHFGLAGRSA